MGQEGGLEEALIAETSRWLERAEELRSEVSGEEQFLDNISAYIIDSRHFLEQGDLIRAFEAVIWAWAWMEIGLGRGILRREVSSAEDDKACSEGCSICHER